MGRAINRKRLTGLILTGCVCVGIVVSGALLSGGGTAVVYDRDGNEVAEFYIENNELQ